ncbi:penicillin-binding protein activator [bacterium]|nr:penicillin-binding protein activator [bacterium]
MKRHCLVGFGVAVTLLSFTLVGCQSTPSKRSKKDMVFSGGAEGEKLNAREAADFQEIKSLYSRASYDAVIPKLQAFEKKHAKSSRIPHVRNLMGLSYLLTKRPVQAINQFRRSLDANSDSGFKNFVLYNLAAAQFEAGQGPETLQTIKEIDIGELDRDTKVKTHFLASKAFMKVGNAPDAAEALLEAAKTADPSQARTVFAPPLEQALDVIADPSILDRVYHAHEDSPIADLVLYRWASKDVAAGKLSSGEANLVLLINKFPQSPKVGESQDMLKSMKSRSVVEPTAVGVLLPMKGRYARFGLKSLQGIQLAFRIFNTDEPDSRFTLVIEDSGEEPEQAIQGLENLFFKHHVAAVIGPLTSKGIDQITQRAQELGLPMISLAQQTGMAGNYVFPSAMTPKSQAYEIARYAIEKMGLRKFAVIHPRDKFGEQLSQHFWDATESMGGEIVGFEAYNTGETDFRQQVDRLTGVHYGDARQRELEILAKSREEANIRKKSRKTDKYFKLTPIVDFQAVFIPDEPKIVGLVIPTFAYRDIERVKFLGIATWHSNELLSRAGNYAEGAVFVDTFFNESSSPQVKKFVSRFSTTFGAEPTAIEALSYDAANILEQVLFSVGSSNRDAIRDGLKRIMGYQGVTGRISYLDGVFQRELNVLTVKGGKFAEMK